MKKLVLAALAAGAVMIPATAAAQVVVRTGGGFQAGSGGSHGDGFRHGGFRHRDRFRVGASIGGFFFAPQFHVRNWQLYGFAPPPPRHQWIRHYDDAYLIDGRGQIYDTRYDVDWDRHGERWDQDRDGIPYYVGDGDYYPDDRDHAYVERERYDYDRYDRSDERYAERDRYDRDDRHDRRGDRYDNYGHDDRYARDRHERDDRYERREYRGGGGWDYSAYGQSGHGYAPGPCASPCGAAPPAYGHGGHGYGYGGYGYMWIPGTTIITETTVTPVVSTMVTEEVVEEVVETRTHRARPRRARPCNCAPPPRRPAPRHPPGERG